MLLLHLWALLSSPSAQKQQLTVRFAPYRCDGSQKGVCSGCLEEDNSAVAHGAENDKGYVYGGHLAKELLLSEKSFAAAGESAEWNLLWTEQAQRCFDVGAKLPLLAGICAKVAAPARRLCNHCNYFGAAGHKGVFAQHMKRVVKQFGPDHVLPVFDLGDKTELKEWAKGAIKDAWIIKPYSGRQSEGIAILSKGNWTAIKQWVGWCKSPNAHQGQASAGGGCHHVAQQFVASPFLLNSSHKFHCRFYILVTKYHADSGTTESLGLWMYQQGLAFVSLSDYSQAGSALAFSSISDDVKVEPLSTVWEAMELVGLDAQRAQAGAKTAIWQLFAAWTSGQAWPRMMPFAQPFSPAVHGECFDLFAVDLIFSSDGRPFVMEVNQGPSLEVDGRYEVESQLKKGLLSQVIAWAHSRLQGKVEGRAPQKKENELLTGFERLSHATGAGGDGGIGDDKQFEL
jgi:hypothetical protein